MPNFSDLYPSGGGIKSVQRGVITLSYTATSATATISPVTTGKTELRMLGYSAGYNSVTAYSARIQLTNSTTITASRIVTDGVGAETVVSWELTEWWS